MSGVDGDSVAVSFQDEEAEWYGALAFVVATGHETGDRLRGAKGIFNQPHRVAAHDGPPCLLRIIWQEFLVVQGIGQGRCRGSRAEEVPSSVL